MLAIITANTLDGQNCFDAVNVTQRGVQAMPPSVQVLVPRSNFSCNGRITGYLISLRQANGSEGYPSVQVWHPTSSTEYTRVDTECALTASDISMMRDGNGNNYHLGNVSCTGNNRIEFQSGDVIGYHHGSSAFYRLWSIDTNGYTSYHHNNTDNSLEIFNINNNSVSLTDNRQPLIEVMYGKINTLTLVMEFSMLVIYFWVIIYMKAIYIHRHKHILAS